MGGARIAGVAACAALLACAPASAAGFHAGAAVRVTTPPEQGSDAGNAADASFAPQFSACTGFPDRGRFALQEPFLDSNSNGQWDAGGDLQGPPAGPPEPYCDANGNGRWDGIYADNNKGPATRKHDDLDVRAFAVSDGTHKPVVYASVDQIGLFDFYTEAARDRLRGVYGVDADLVVSANHNESSPDSIGLFGAGTTPLNVGVRSGIDEYYMDYLVDGIAHAAADAATHMQPARLFANQVEGAIPDGTSGNYYPMPRGLSQRLSDQFPTTVAHPDFAPQDNRVAAVDPKVGVLQARGADGTPIFTVMSYAAHNQEMGNAGAELSADWPGVFERSFDAKHAGTAIFLAGDVGSQEDPTASPPDSERRDNVPDQFAVAASTGQRFAELAAAAAKDASRLTEGDVTLKRRELCVPLENNGFVALAAAGEFGRRQGWACDSAGNPIAPIPNGAIVPTASTHFRTFVGYTDIGPDLQLLDDPAEAFPALMMGTPFGAEEVSCDRPNPPVPTWHARAPYRFQVGLADDIVGYLIPAWGFASGTPGLFQDTCYADAHGRGHKLESESVGPTGSNTVASALTDMLVAGGRDQSAEVRDAARFVLPDGSYSRWPTGAVGALIAANGAGSLASGAGTLVGAPRTAGFGARAVDASGLFMDYDGQPQARPDVTTRGMIVLDPRGCVVRRYYLNVFPQIGVSDKLGPAREGPAVTPSGRCAGGGTAPGVQPDTVPASECRDRERPRSTVAGRPRLRHGRIVLRGRSADRGCAALARVTVTVRNRKRQGSCRYLTPAGRLGHRQRCKHGPRLLARGTASWRLRVRAKLPRGRYILVARAVDTAGNTETAHHRGPNVARLRVRRR